MSDDGPPSWAIQRVLREWHGHQQTLVDDDKAVIESVMQAERGGINGILAWLVRAIRDAASMAAAVKAECADLAVRQKRFEDRKIRHRATLSTILEIAVRPDESGHRRLVLPIATLSLGPGSLDMQVTDEALIPDEYYADVQMVKVRKGLKKDRILSVMTTERIDEETGEVLPPLAVPGVALSNGGPTLTIRGK